MAFVFVCTERLCFTRISQNHLKTQGLCLSIHPPISLQVLVDDFVDVHMRPINSKQSTSSNESRHLTRQRIQGVEIDAFIPWKH